MGISQRLAKRKPTLAFTCEAGHVVKCREEWKMKRLFSCTGEKHEVISGAKKVLPFERIPGPKSHRVLGTLPRYIPIFGEYSMEALHKNALLNYQLYGKLVRERILPSVNLLHVYHPEDMGTVFRSEGRYPERRSHLALHQYRMSKPDVYNTGGLLSTNGPDWWRLRSSFQKSMTSPQSVRNFISRTDQVAQEFVSWILKTLQQGDIEDLLPFLNRLFLETIAIVAFDTKLHSFSPEEQATSSRSSRLIEAAFRSNSGVLKLDHGFLWKIFKTPLYRRMTSSQEYLEKFSKEVLTSKLKLFQSKSQKFSEDPTSLLDSFLSLTSVDMKDVVGMMVDLLMAAVDTTSYSTSFLLYHIARNSEVQDKLFQEILQLLPSKDTAVTADVIARAVYSKSCIKESLRLNPIAIGVGRVLQTDVVLSGYQVPAGTVVVTQNMVASRLHQHCQDPDTFEPARWLRQDGRYQRLHPFLSLPFGFGPRSCIARRLAEQTMCINLLKIVRNFHLDWSSGDMDVKTLLINKPDCPVQLKMTQRTN